MAAMCLACILLRYLGETSTHKLWHLLENQHAHQYKDGSCVGVETNLNRGTSGAGRHRVQGGIIELLSLSGSWLDGEQTGAEEVYKIKCLIGFHQICYRIISC
jgi:hypothetical protein